MKRCVVSDDWYEAGKRGTVLFDEPALDHNGMEWTAVLFDDEEDPTFYKTRSLAIVEGE